MSYLELIKNERQFRSTTGYDKATFRALLKDFTMTYEEIKGKSYEVYLSEHLLPGEEAKLKSLEAILFFLLYQKKNDLIWDSLAFTFRMATSTAYDYFNKYLPILEATLEKKT